MTLANCGVIEANRGYFFSSSGPKACLCRPYVCMYVRVSTFSNIFSFETIKPIQVNFHMEPSLGEGTKVCPRGPGHMTKMAAMLIYGKNLIKSFSPEPKGR